MKGNKGVPLQAWTDPWGSRRLRLLEFLDNRHKHFTKWDNKSRSRIEIDLWPYAKAQLSVCLHQTCPNFVNITCAEFYQNVTKNV